MILFSAVVLYPNGCIRLRVCNEPMSAGDGMLNCSRA